MRPRDDGVGEDDPGNGERPSLLDLFSRNLAESFGVALGKAAGTAIGVAIGACLVAIGAAAVGELSDLQATLDELRRQAVGW